MITGYTHYSISCCHWTLENISQIYHNLQKIFKLVVLENPSEPRRTETWIEHRDWHNMCDRLWLMQCYLIFSTTRICDYTAIITYEVELEMVLTHGTFPTHSLHRGLALISTFQIGSALCQHLALQVGYISPGSFSCACVGKTRGWSSLHMPWKSSKTKSEVSIY